MNESPFLFAAVSFAITIVLAEIFERAMDKLDKALKFWINSFTKDGGNIVLIFSGNIRPYGEIYCSFVGAIHESPEKNE